jgi:hypothetical protein
MNSVTEEYLNKLHAFKIKHFTFLYKLQEDKQLIHDSPVLQRSELEITWQNKEIGLDKTWEKNRMIQLKTSKRNFRF